LADTNTNRETPTDKLGNFDSFFAASIFLAHLTLPAHSQLRIPRIIPLDLQNENKTENQHDTRAGETAVAFTGQKNYGSIFYLTNINSRRLLRVSLRFLFIMFAA
jgi:hypothetical protein